MTIKDKLLAIQCELKAPKNLYNSFGKYNYRNAEGIMEAVKPFLKKNKVVLIVSDDIVNCGDSNYVKATARLTDVESDGDITVIAFAREAVEKKGMDDSQITGTASSYARKYALNGLFLLDDTKDADTNEYHTQTNAKEQKKSEPKKTDAAVPVAVDTHDLLMKLKENGIRVDYVLKLYGVKAIEDVSQKQYNNIISHLADIKAKQEEKKDE